ncbi:unnamed protein product [Zymoseptoria tritici ST99CH_3D1]|nr:unnamed protein product [Zymoseptoria tritici ST99CH_3D1]
MAAYSDHDHDHDHGSGPGPGETYEEHALHSKYQPQKHWGLGWRAESTLFYCFVIPSWCFEIASAVLGSFENTEAHPFIATCTIWLVLWATAWLQTAVLMVQRASWVRDEANLEDRKQYLYLSVRLQRLMMLTISLVTWIIALPVFIQAYVRRDHFDDLPYWLIFLLFFIFNIVGCVMNAYNNITWELDRLLYEEGEPPMKHTRLAIVGISS